MKTISQGECADDAAFTFSSGPYNQRIIPSAAAEDVAEGLQFHRVGECEKAMVCYRRAIGREPDHALAHYLLGLLLISGGDPLSAENEWHDAMKSAASGPLSCWAQRQAQRLLLENKYLSELHNDDLRSEETPATVSVPKCAPGAAVAAQNVGVYTGRSICSKRASQASLADPAGKSSVQDYDSIVK